MGSYKNDVLCSVGWGNAALLQGPTSAQSLQDLSYVLRDCWEPSLPTGPFHCAIAPLLLSTRRQETKYSFTWTHSCVPRSKLYQKMPFLGAGMGAVWNVSLRNRFLPTPAQALGCWGKNTAGIAFRLLSEVFLPTSTTTALFLL